MNRLKTLKTVQYFTNKAIYSRTKYEIAKADLQEKMGYLSTSDLLDLVNTGHSEAGFVYRLKNKASDDAANFIDVFHFIKTNM